MGHWHFYNCIPNRNFTNRVNHISWSHESIDLLLVIFLGGKQAKSGEGAIASKDVFDIHKQIIKNVQQCSYEYAQYDSTYYILPYFRTVHNVHNDAWFIN